jgi:ferrous iron transport protein B
MPTLRMVLWHVVEKSWLYIRKAGTIILFFSVLIWVTTRYPEPPARSPEHAVAATAPAGTAPTGTAPAGTAPAGTAPAGTGIPVLRVPETTGKDEPRSPIADSFAGQFGRFLEPVFRPIGFDWKLTIALLTGAAAKEVTVSTLAVLYQTGENETPDGETPGLRRALAADPAMSPLTGWLFMLFTLVVFPCAATLAVVRSELGGRWLAFMIAYLAGGAWLLCFLIYQGARLFGYA